LPESSKLLRKESLDKMEKDIKLAKDSIKNFGDLQAKMHKMK
jgi:hypothetical protein